MSTSWGIATLLNMRRQTSGQMVIMPNGRSNSDDVISFLAILCDYVTGLLLEKTDGVLLIYTPTTAQAFEVENLFKNPRIMARSLNFEFRERTLRKITHTVIFSDVERYSQLNPDWFNIFGKHKVKLTLFLYRDHDDEAEESSSFDPIFEFEEHLDTTTEISKEKVKTERYFLLRETEARGVVVAWIKNFPHSVGPFTEFADSAISDPTEPLATVVKRLYDVILV